MNLKNQRWIFSVALVWTVELLFPPSGSASTYGRVTNTEWRPIWDMKATLNTPFLLIEMLVSGLLIYGAWVMLATRTPKEKPVKAESATPEHSESAHPNALTINSAEKSPALIDKFQTTIDYNWSVAKYWTVKEDVELVSALKHQFGEDWERQYRQLRIPEQGQMYGGESLPQPSWEKTETGVLKQPLSQPTQDSNSSRYKPVNVGVFLAIMGVLAGLMVFATASDSSNASSSGELIATWLVATCGLAIAFAIRLWWGDNARRMSRDRGLSDWFWGGIILGFWASLFLWMFPRTTASTPEKRTSAKPEPQKAAPRGRVCSACGCLLSPTMISCPRCKADTPLSSDMAICSRCQEVFPKDEGACPACSEGLGY